MLHSIWCNVCGITVLMVQHRAGVLIGGGTDVGSNWSTAKVGCASSLSSRAVVVELMGVQPGVRMQGRAYAAILTAFTIA